MINPRILPLLVLLALAGCREQSSRQDVGAVTMQIGRQKFTLELANTQSSRRRGLMYRSSLPSDRGMMFVFGDEQPRNFYMKNTEIPLDIIFLDAKGKIVSIHQMQPLDETNVPSDAPAKYAIELKAGAAAQAGVQVGQTLNIPSDAADPADF